MLCLACALPAVCTGPHFRNIAQSSPAGRMARNRVRNPVDESERLAAVLQAPRPRNEPVSPLELCYTSVEKCNSCEPEGGYSCGELAASGCGLILSECNSQQTFVSAATNVLRPRHCLAPWQRETRARASRHNIAGTTAYRASYSPPS
jgi:hypothetical protein